MKDLTGQHPKKDTVKKGIEIVLKNSKMGAGDFMLFCKEVAKDIFESGDIQEMFEKMILEECPMGEVYAFHSAFLVDPNDETIRNTTSKLLKEQRYLRAGEMRKFLEDIGLQNES